MRRRLVDRGRHARIRAAAPAPSRHVAGPGGRTPQAKADNPMMQHDDNQKNLLLAIVLSIGVLLFWQFYYAGPKMQQERERAARQQQQAQHPQGTPAPGQPATTPGSAPV